VEERQTTESCNGCGASFESWGTYRKVAIIPEDYQTPEEYLAGDYVDAVKDKGELVHRWECIAKQAFCDECLRKARAPGSRETEAQRNTRLAKTFEEICPAFYRAPAIRAAMTAKMGPQVKAVTELVKQHRGVLAYGDSGHFKTTVLFNAAVRWLVWNNFRPRYIRGSEWRQQTSQAAMDGNLDKWLRSFKTVPWLFLDDVGHMNGTPTAEEALLEILEVRMQEERPVLVSTQYEGDGLIARFSTPQRGDAICRRLALLAEPVAF
jgi:DNA replication protein DnaC